MRRNTDLFTRILKVQKPVVARVHGSGAIAGGSDIALMADFIVMQASASIGYPPARVWGVPTTAGWLLRLNAFAARRLLFTGDVVSGEEAAACGIAHSAHHSVLELDCAVDCLVARLASVPANQLAMLKLLANSALHAQGLEQAQTLATLFDGVARHTTEGAQFKKLSEERGFKFAVAQRDAKL